MPAGDSSAPLEDFSQDLPSGASGQQADLIQAINANGFEVGSGDANGLLTNDDAGVGPDVPYYWLTFRNESGAAAGGITPFGGFGGFELPFSPYTLLKSLLDAEKRYKRILIR